MTTYKLKNFIPLIIFNFSSCFSQDLPTIHVVSDNLYEGKYYLNSEGFITEFMFQDSTHSRDVILKYTYTEKGEISKINSVGGNNNSNFDEEIEIKKMKDAIYRTAFLEKKGIKFPLSFINSSELGDMANIFSVSDRFKTIIHGNEKIINFDNLNLKVSFKSTIEKYIPHLTVIKSYKILLNGNTVIKEEFVFDGGFLERSYTYDEHKRLTSILWNCVYDNDSKKYSEIKNISYLK